MVSSSSNRELISSSQIVAQGGVYLNITHPEVKQRYVDKEMMKEYADKYGMPIICMRCACDLASPADVKGKAKMVERTSAKERLSIDTGEQSQPNVRPPVKQTDGLFYDRHRDHYYLKRSRYDEYGPQGQPMFNTGPEKTGYFKEHHTSNSVSTREKYSQKG